MEMATHSEPCQTGCDMSPNYVAGPLALEEDDLGARPISRYKSTGHEMHCPGRRFRRRTHQRDYSSIRRSRENHLTSKRNEGGTGCRVRNEDTRQGIPWRGCCGHGDDVITWLPMSHALWECCDVTNCLGRRRTMNPPNASKGIVA
jgi:hypothetical protein